MGLRLLMTGLLTGFSIAAFGLTVVSGALIEGRFWLRLIGGVFLCYLGVRTILAEPAQHPATARARHLTGAYVSTLMLTLTNPMTVLSFAAVFAGLWWATLSAGVGLLRARVGPPLLVWVNRVSGTIIAGFGLIALLGLAG